MDRVLKAHEHLTERGKTSVAYAMEALPELDIPKQDQSKCQTPVPETTEFLYIMFYEPTVCASCFIFVSLFPLSPVQCPIFIDTHFLNSARSRTIGSTGLCCTLHASPFIRGTVRSIM